MLSKALRYPLQTQTLSSAIAAFSVALLILLGGHYAYASSEAGELLFWRYSFVSCFAYVYLLFEYGMDIIENSAWGEPTAPVLRSSLYKDAMISPFTVGDLRFFKQTLLLILYLGFAQKIYAAGYTAMAMLLLCWLFVIWPASMLNNAIYNRFLSMLNPISLCYSIKAFGWTYVPIMLLLNAAWTVGILSLFMDIATFALLFPLFLYSWFLALHMLGDRVHHKHEQYFSVIDFKADRQELQNTSAALSGLNLCLTTAYEYMRAGKKEDAVESIMHWLNKEQWQHFEQVFSYVSAWPYSQVALILCKRQIPWLIEQQKIVRALQLIDWCLCKDRHFVVKQLDVLATLCSSAIDKSQAAKVMQLLINFSEDSSLASSKRPALQLALKLAGEILQDEQCFHNLTASLTALPDA